MTSGGEWQAPVERTLIEEADNPALVIVTAALPIVVDSRK